MVYLLENCHGLSVYEVSNLPNSNNQICGETKNTEAFPVDLQKLKDDCRDGNIFNAYKTASTEKRSLLILGRSSQKSGTFASLLQ